MIIPLRRSIAIEPSLLGSLTDAGLATLLLPGLSLLASRPRENAGSALIAVAAAVAAYLLSTRLLPRRSLALLGASVVAVAALLLAQVSFPPTVWLIALNLGTGVALAHAGRRGVGPRTAPIVVVTAAALVLLHRTISLDAALMTGTAGVVIMAAVALATPPIQPPAGRRVLVTAGTVIVVATVLTVSWVGASTSRATWFGSLVSHGPRQEMRVAITFDDGPNVDYTLRIRDILDAYGVKATFFTVGKALDARPDISRALLTDGQLLGNHSYRHDSVHWLDPTYGEVGMTQHAFKRELGVCPVFFRPPHGTHTPFMAHQVQTRGMKMVTWDVSAGDWATDEGGLVAARVLAKAKPGSIILLHDGIDGDLHADRSVIIRALPLILDGLKARGLQVVTLADLLGVPGYRPNC